jgi:hypothetical protein
MNIDDILINFELMKLKSNDHFCGIVYEVVPTVINVTNEILNRFKIENINISNKHDFIQLLLSQITNKMKQEYLLKTNEEFTDVEIIICNDQCNYNLVNVGFVLKQFVKKMLIVDAK